MPRRGNTSIDLRGRPGSTLHQEAIPRIIDRQCEIIHGLLPGKLLAPFLPRLVRRIDLPLQQAQPAPWLFTCDNVCGAWALRSLVA
jgi:hypothetical protein